MEMYIYSKNNYIFSNVWIGILRNITLHCQTNGNINQ